MRRTLKSVWAIDGAARLWRGRFFAVVLCAVLAPVGGFSVAGAGKATASEASVAVGDDLKNEALQAYYEERYGKALRLFQSLSAQGDGQAAYYLYLIYHIGKGVPADRARAKAYLLQGVERGYARAIYILGLSHILNIEGYALDVDKGVALTKQAADLGDPDAQHDYGKYVLHGQFDVEQDTALALRYFERAAAQDHVKGLKVLAGLYVLGGFVDKNPKKSFFYMEKAAKLGDAGAQSLLASYYRDGWGTEPNQQKAAYWYGKSAAQDEPDALGEYGRLLIEGEVVAQDIALGLSTLHRSAELGNTQAWVFLARLYQQGRAVPQDFVQAVVYLRKAAEAANVEAQGSLGWAYEAGEGVEQDYAEARKWYVLAAQQENATALGRLAGVYLNGLGVTANAEVAHDYALRGANLGDDRSMGYLGAIYGLGLTGEKDRIEAAKWTWLAILYGGSEAEKELGPLYNSLRSKLSPEQQEELDRRLAAWLEENQSGDSMR